MSDILTSYMALEKRKADLKVALDEVESQMKVLHDPLLSYFDQHGTQSHKANGRMIYLERARNAAKKDKTVSPEALCQSLHDLGFSDYAPERVNWQGLGKFFRDREDEGEEPVPEELQGLLQMDTEYRIKGRKA